MPRTRTRNTKTTAAAYTIAWEPTGDWMRAYASCSRQTRILFLKKMHKRLHKIGKGVAQHIRASMAKGGPPLYRYQPLHTFTMAQKGKGSPLVDRGTLMREVKAHEMSELAIFVGVASSRKVGGIGLSRLAQVQEEGIFIKITPAMRGWLMANDFGDHVNKAQPARKDGRKGWIRIPPRPFIKPYFRDSRLLAPTMKAIQTGAEQELDAAITEIASTGGVR